MLQIGFWELLLVLLIAFVIVGPQDLPKVARWMGKGFKKLRRLMARLRVEMGLDELDRESQGIQREIGQIQREMDISQPITQAEAALQNSVQAIREAVSPATRLPGTETEGGEKHASGNN